MQVVELAPDMGPTRCQHDVAPRGQSFEAGIAIDLQHSTEALEVIGRTFCLAIGTVEVDGSRRLGP